MPLLSKMLGNGNDQQWAPDYTGLPSLLDAEAEKVSSYLSSNRVPFFSPGYEVYKLRLVLEICASKKFRSAFQAGDLLPEPFGPRLDERIVEYPWVFSRLPHELPHEQKQNSDLILDAGSTFNKKMLLESPFLTNRRLLIYTMETDWITYNPLVSYLFGDLRDMILKDSTANTIVCISTLEHVGFTYDYKNYSKNVPWPHEEPESYVDALREFRRVLKPGGRLLLTLPFGRYENHGWLQQFDAVMIDRVKDVFAGEVCSEHYYRYQDGWQVTAPEQCSRSSYFNIHETGEFEEDGLAAARGICCLELRKPAS